MTRTTNDLTFYLNDVVVKTTTVTYETANDPQAETNKIGKQFNAGGFYAAALKLPDWNKLSINDNGTLYYYTRL